MGKAGAESLEKRKLYNGDEIELLPPREVATILETQSGYASAVEIATVELTEAIRADHKPDLSFWRAVMVHLKCGDRPRDVKTIPF